jgi:hypothetical protein
MTDVHVGKVTNSMRPVDGDPWSSPQMIDRIVVEVLRVIDERHAHRERVKQERRTECSDYDWESGGDER